MEDTLQEIKALEERIAKSSDFMEKMELKDKLTELKRAQGILKPPNQEIECFGCGS